MTDNPTYHSPYHSGEIQVQRKLGTSEMAKKSARMITPGIPPGAISFIEKQPMAIIGSLDLNGRVWTSVLLGLPGFIQVTGESTIELHVNSLCLNKDDPLWQNIKHHPYIGMIIIETGSRRRLRINGRLNETDHNKIEPNKLEPNKTNNNATEYRYQVLIDQAFPNCAKYIQKRHIKKAALFQNKKHSADKTGEQLQTQQLQLISAADTFFVSSIYTDNSGTDKTLDTSHRGGTPGFIEILNSRQLRIPDYPGNNLFNTLGNFLTNPRAGLVFIDFENKKLLQLSGQAKIIWRIDNTSLKTAGSLRHWEFTVERWRESVIPFDIEWAFLQASAFNP
ncbi:hypothetical protein MNBD_GAMMA09-2264 [hydrothermal vent metagenome]|uniref:Iron-sulfur binding protein YPO1417 n=1 Tax=hydrothermal vent metagenome TaxID=652676 RepID=A0A3B0XGV1_9ZZZZ